MACMQLTETVAQPIEGAPSRLSTVAPVDKLFSGQGTRFISG
jgi:hypothetical protein